ncbi:RPM1-interacting protein 4-like, partial [Trifolium medium]|nr:RPM1-interacting protein 4-like [Trifolium medium]
MINPNDPEENSDLVLQSSSSADEIPPKPRVHSENLSEKGPVKSTHDELQNGDLKQFVNSPARHDNLNKSAGDSVHRPGVASADNRRRPSRQSTAGSEYSVERSPLHRQAKTPGRDSPS